MAIQPAVRCLFPQDIDAALQALRQDLGDRVEQAKGQVAELEAAVPAVQDLVNQGNNLLDQILAATDGTTALTSVAASQDVLGLPKTPGDSVEQNNLEAEQFLFNNGFTVLDGTLYVPPQFSRSLFDAVNIKNLRRLYIAVGRDLQKTEELLSSTKTRFVVNSVEIATVLASDFKERIPPNVGPFVPIKLSDPARNRKVLDVIRKKLKDESIVSEQVAFSEDGSAKVLVRKFIDVDKSVDKIEQNFTSSNPSSITSSVFHFDRIQRGTAFSNKVTNLGYDTDEARAIRRGKDLKDVPSTSALSRVNDPAFLELVNAVEKGNFKFSEDPEEKEAEEELFARAQETGTSPPLQTISENKVDVGLLINKLRFFQKRHTKLDKEEVSEESAKIVPKLQADLNKAVQRHVDAIGQTVFEVTLITQKDVLEKLRKKNNDASIVKLLEKRVEIEGIFFEATDEDISKLLVSASQIQPGSKVASTTVLNQQREPKSVGNVSIFELMQMYVFLNDAKTRLDNLGANTTGGFTNAPFGLSVQDEVNQIINFLQQYSGHSVIPVEPQEAVNGLPFQGQPSLTTPSSIIIEQVDFGVTLGLNDKVETVTAATQTLFELYPQEIAQFLADLILELVALFLAAIQACVDIVNAIKGAILDAKKALEALLSFNLSFSGGGNFDLGLFKCAFNLDLGINIDLFGPLLSLLGELQFTAGGFLNGLANLLASIIEEILCFPINLINGLLGKLQSFLPAFCQVPRVDLGPELTAALEALTNIAVSKSVSFGASNKDLIGVELALGTARDKLGAFVGGGSCISEEMSTFFGASTLNLGV